MALPYLTVVLTIVLFNLGSSRQQPHTSVCEKKYSGCVGFLNKQDNFSSYRQCLKACDFKNVPTAKSRRAYSCIDYSKPCSPLKFYQIHSSTDAFFEWTKCLEVCHALTNALPFATTPTAPAPEPETGGFKCDEDSQTCVSCTDEDGECSDLSTCQESCGKEAPESETGGFKCDEDYNICVPCTDEEDECSDLSTCEETCGNEA
nr:unnamed protein product [Spirometra erinaceieuropaei]